MAGDGGGRVHLGAIGHGAARDRAGLGRVGLRQPGQLPRTDRVLQRAACPRGLPAGRPDRLVDVVHAAAAGLSVAAVRPRTVPCPPRLAGAVSSTGAGVGGCPVREPVGDRALRSAGDAQLLGRDRRARGRRLLPARPVRPHPARCGVWAGRECGTDGVDAARGRRMDESAAARGVGCRAPVALLAAAVRSGGGAGGRGGRVGDRDAPQLRRAGRPADQGLPDPGRPGLQQRRRRPAAQPGRTYSVPPVYRDHAGRATARLVVRPAGVRGRRAGGGDEGPAHGGHAAAPGLRGDGGAPVPVPDRVRRSPLPAARLRAVGHPGRRHTRVVGHRPETEVAPPGCNPCGGGAHQASGGAVRGAPAHRGAHHRRPPGLGPRHRRTAPPRHTPAVPTHQARSGPDRLLRRALIRRDQWPQRQHHQGGHHPDGPAGAGGGADDPYGTSPSYARSWHPYRMDNGTFAYVAPAAPESGRR